MSSSTGTASPICRRCRGGPCRRRAPRSCRPRSARHRGPAPPRPGGAGAGRRQPDQPRDAGRPAVPAGARHSGLAGALRAERGTARGADRGRRRGAAGAGRGRAAHLRRLRRHRRDRAAVGLLPGRGAAMSDVTVAPVTFEHHREPLGIGEATPRLSWVVRTGLPGWRQAAYELEIGDWSSGRVASAESVLVPWGAPPLASREQRAGRVRVWGEGDAEPSAWSESAVVEAGLLSPQDWSAQLVQPLLPDDAEEPVLLLRREFTLDKPVARARLYATAQGVYEAELNGVAVSADVLAPGWTSYRHRLRYSTYDVTALLTEGVNALGAQLADGWFRGYIGFTGGRVYYGDRTGLFAQLEVEHPDGSRTVVTTDGTW